MSPHRSTISQMRDLHYGEAMETYRIHNDSVETLLHNRNSNLLFRPVHYLISLYLTPKQSFLTLQRIWAMVPSMGERRGMRKSLLTTRYPISSF